MNLFNPIVEQSKLHPNFVCILTPFRQSERDLFSNWAEGFEDRDGKFLNEFQTTFNSSFWEIYLHACFKKYGFEQDWSKASPDFCMQFNDIEFVVEATTANAAQGKPNEWDKVYISEEIKGLRFRKLNTEAIIRLSNAILKKLKRYETYYRTLDHVYRKPFVVAVAPFEQPHFNLQYDRPIRALLYDHYVDEDAYLDDPESYPNGPPSIQLGYVEKENGSEIPLGIFNDNGMAEISAIIFSCTATWGKLSALSKNPLTNTQIVSTWSTAPTGAPERRTCSPSEHDETILDGLQIYHNPYASCPLPPDTFRAPRVVQHFFDEDSQEWVYEGRLDALQFRLVLAEPKK